METMESIELTKIASEGVPIWEIKKGDDVDYSEESLQNILSNYLKNGFKIIAQLECEKGKFYGPIKKLTISKI